MGTQRLTKSVIDRLVPKSSEFIEWDVELTGFGVRVHPTGRKVFIASYRTGGRNSPKRRVTIGTVGGGLTCDQARKKAEAVLARASLGEDEAAELTAARRAKSVAELCAEYLEDGVDRKAASTLAADKGRIARHIVPLIGRKMIVNVAQADVEQMMRDIAKGKTAVYVENVKTRKQRAIVRGGKGTATRTVRLLGGIFTFAIKRGYRADNPTRGVEKYPDKKGERFLSNAELERLGVALRQAETTGIPWAASTSKHAPKVPQAAVMAPHVAAAIRLLMFTGCRLREILHLRWQEIDFERGMLFLPKSKTGKKSVILNAPALEILNTLPRLGVYVIAGQSAGAKDEKPRSDLKRPWEALTKHASLVGLRIHDLRHSFASVGAGASLGLPVIGALLGHKDVATTQRYSHLDNDPLRKASNAIGATIQNALAGKTSEVVNLKAARLKRAMK